METVKLEAKDIQIGQPRILSTVGSIELKETCSNVINFEIIPPSEIVPGNPRIYKTVPGVEGHENLPRPFFSMQQMLKTWDNFNSELYQVICEIKDLTE